MNKAPNRTLFFYQLNKLICIKQGDQHRSIFRHADVPLAEHQVGGDPSTALLATDDKGSVLVAADEGDSEDHLYSAYGHDPNLPSARTAAGFNGEFFEPHSICYRLGQGYRALSVVLMRFLSADSWSPFGQGGTNAYTYCSGDPINNTDPSGHVLVRVPPASALTPRAPSTPSYLESWGKRIVQRFKVDHYESLTTKTIVTTGKGRNTSSQVSETTRRTLRTTELFEVIADPHKGPATVHVTRTQLDSFLEASNNLRNAQAANALVDSANTVSTAYIRNLENFRRGLTVSGEDLARRANNPNDLTAYLAGSFRVSDGNSKIRQR